MSYLPSYSDMYRRAAVLVEKILKGAKPADLPVEFPIRFELAVGVNDQSTLILAELQLPSFSISQPPMNTSASTKTGRSCGHAIE